MDIPAVGYPGCVGYGRYTSQSWIPGISKVWNTKESPSSSKKRHKTYNSGYSLVVTYLATNPLVCCLNRAEQTGGLVVSWLLTTKVRNTDVQLHQQLAAHNADSRQPFLRCFSYGNVKLLAYSKREIPKLFLGSKCYSNTIVEVGRPSSSFLTEGLFIIFLSSTSSSAQGPPSGTVAGCASVT
jgi:hypothetical protein